MRLMIAAISTIIALTALMIAAIRFSSSGFIRVSPFFRSYLLSSFLITVYHIADYMSILILEEFEIIFLRGNKIPRSGCGA